MGQKKSEQRLPIPERSHFRWNVVRLIPSIVAEIREAGNENSTTHSVIITALKVQTGGYSLGYTEKRNLHTENKVY